MKRLIAKIMAVLTATVLLVTAAAIPVSADNSAKKIPDTEAMRFVDSLGVGWNLGDDLDILNKTFRKYDIDRTYPKMLQSDKLRYEEHFNTGQRENYKALIKSVKDTGFSTARIPVTWIDHVDKDFKIIDEWLYIVKDIIDMCLDEGLYVVIDMHNDVWKGYYYPDKENLKTSRKYIKAIWTQLAETFKDYDERLVFEVINEPRLRGNIYEWGYSGDDVPAEIRESVECINELNQLAVKTIRSAGGKNTERYIMVGGYDTSYGVSPDIVGENWYSVGIISELFKLPKDTAENKLIVTVHIYTESEEVGHSMLDGIYEKFVLNGVPAVLTEYGLIPDYYPYKDKQEFVIERFSDFTSYARARGISAMIWDDPEKTFFDHETAEPLLPEVLKAFVDAGKPVLTAGKPQVRTTAYKNKVVLNWNKVDGAAKYAVYQYKNGKFTKVKNVTVTSAVIKNLTSGKTYKFIVRAYINGKWTPAAASDAVKATTKK